MAVPYIFGTATAAIPLSQLDTNFATPITIGNTAVALSDTVTTLNNMTLANVTITSGTVTITNVAVTTANVSGTANVSTLVVVGNETVGGNTTVAGNITVSGGTANGVAYLNTSKVLTTGSALVFDGTNLGVGTPTPASPLHITSSIAPSSGSILRIDGTATTTYSATSYVGGQIRLNYTNASSRYGGINFSNTGATSQDFFGVVQNGSGYGDFVFQGYNGSEYAERMRLDSSGNLGLGVTPSANAGQRGLFLTGYNGGYSALSLGASGGGYGVVGYNLGFTATEGTFKALASDGMSWVRFQNGQVQFFQQSAATAGTNYTGTQAMTLDASGNLLVGTTSVNGRVTSDSTTAGTNQAFWGKSSGGTAGTYVAWNAVTTGNPIFLDCYTETSATQRGYIYFDRVAGQTKLSATSDVRLKENITDAPSALPVIESIKVRQYNWKETGTTNIGFIAQELHTIVDRAVSVGEDNEDGTIKRPWGVDNGTLVPYLVKAIQEQQSIIQQLTDRITALEAK